jgi:hypothetical protein
MNALSGCRRAVFLIATLVTMLATVSRAGATEVIRIRTGQVGGAPGTCSQIDDGFHGFSPTSVSCGQPLLATPFSAAAFASAAGGPMSHLVNRIGWFQPLGFDPQARWINWGEGSPCRGGPRSALYAYRFRVNSCSPVADVDVCWAADDQLGDAGASGPNPVGVYLNGVALNASFSGGAFNVETCAQQAGIPLYTGDNWLYVYQRDIGCGVAGLLLSATLTVHSAGPCPTVAVTKFDDFDGDGIQDFGEPGLSGWRINGTGPATFSDTTDANGQVFFTCVPSGNYQLTEVTRPGWIQTGPAGGVANLSVTCDMDFATSFGNRRCGLATCVPLPNCLRARFPFDEGSGTTANEVMANRDGVITGGGSSPTWGGASPASGTSLGFPGSPGTQQVAVADCPEHNFSTGSFSIVGWFKNNNSDFDIHTLVDKRVPSTAILTGYAFFVKFQRLGFQIGDGSSTPATYFMSSGPLVNDNAWHFGAATVCRNPANPSSNVVTIVMDNFVDTFTVGIPTGSVTNTAGLVIGDQCPGFLAGLPFKGSLDEIQLYRCCLSGAQLAALKLGAVEDGQGYCQESCQLPVMVSSYLPYAPSLLRICNYSLTPQTYRWTVARASSCRS